MNQRWNVHFVVGTLTGYFLAEENSFVACGGDPLAGEAEAKLGEKFFEQGGGVAVREEETKGFALLVGEGLAVERDGLGGGEMEVDFDAE